MDGCTTLTSLALLKSYIDEKKDCLDYLIPFISDSLKTHNPDIIITYNLAELLRKDFGLVIPPETVEIVLKRIQRTGGIKRDGMIYRITDKLEAPNLEYRKKEAEQHKQRVISGLINHDNKAKFKISTEQEANDALCAFLSEFSIPCFKAFLRGTALPEIHSQNEQIVLVSLYVIEIQKNDPDVFESFMVVLQGHMLANALTAPDLLEVSPSYKQLTFYFDTPLIIRALGLEGEHKQNAVTNLMGSLLALGGKLAVFKHTDFEIECVIKGAAEHIEKTDGRGPIIVEARRRRDRKSDILMALTGKKNLYEKYQVTLIERPPLNPKFHIDEVFFDKIIDEEISYNNEYAKDFDRQSVIGIFTLRQSRKPSCLEDSLAVLVTSNSALATAAFEYGRTHDEGRIVSTVITNFSLANMVWLKSPIKASQIPGSELLAFAYAALALSPALWNRFLEHLEKLERHEKITPEQHQMLRCNSVNIQQEIMTCTLGSEDDLNDESVYAIIQRIQDELKKDEKNKHERTSRILAETQMQLERTSNREMFFRQKIYSRCEKKAKSMSTVILSIMGVLISIGLISSYFSTGNKILKYIFSISGVFFILMTFFNLFFGSTMWSLSKKLERRLLAAFINKESKDLGINFEE